SLIRTFFVSSRRRHTRSKRDWSSDVCSSDLRRCRLGALAAGGAPLCPGRTARTFSVIAFYLVRFAYSSTLCGLLQALSVSRLRQDRKSVRVGKEGRSRGVE